MIVPLTEIMPKGFDAVRTGKRNMGWRNDKPATLYYVVALDDGDTATKVPFRDEVFPGRHLFLKPPVRYKTQQRFAGISWGDEK